MYSRNFREEARIRPSASYWIKVRSVDKFASTDCVTCDSLQNVVVCRVANHDLWCTNFEQTSLC